MTTNDKINAKLDEWETRQGSASSIRGLDQSESLSLIAALRIALEALQRCEKRTLHAKNGIFAIAEKLGVKP
jgi:hypothetical protein